MNNTPPLDPQALQKALSTLPRWAAVHSDNPKPAQELCGSFTLPSFESAIDFMSTAVPIINAHNHHPRWENPWKTVTVCLTTWDIGGQISELDITLARAFEEHYSEFIESR